MTVHPAVKLLLLLAVLVFALPAYSDPIEPSKAQAETSSSPTFIDLADTKFSAGGSIRLRQEIWTNTVFLGAKNSATGGPFQYDRDFFRLRVSLWGQADIGKNFDVYAKLTTEPKYNLGPYHQTVVGESHGQYTDQDEVIVDNLYITGKKLLNGVLDVRVGRQDFMSPDDIYGEGFLIMDGTPGDGSRSFYFNAAKFRFNITPQNSVDVVYITDSDTDTLMPSLHPAISGNSLYISNRRLLNTSHEQGVILYSRNKFSDIATFDPYYIYKVEDGFLTNPRLKLHTFGGRATVNYKGWRAKGELAYQFGEYDKSSVYPDGIDRTGLGGYFFFGRKFEEVPGKPEIDLGVVYYSGDNRNDGANKRSAFDPLFARFPSWNELLVYTLIPENSAKYANGVPGYWTNLAIAMIKGKVGISKTTALTATYQYLMAPEKTSGLNPDMFSNDSRDRGHLFTGILTQNIMKNLDGMLQFEYFIPGKFYAANTNDAVFFRWQLQYKF
jgi:hypothetical protein